MENIRLSKTYNDAFVMCCHCKKETEPFVFGGQSDGEIMVEAADYVRSLGWKAVTNGKDIFYTICPECWNSRSLPFDEEPLKGEHRMNEIEKKFADALCRECGVDSLEDMQDEEMHCLSLCEAQKPIDIYIADFYMEDCSNNKYVVEIDGHESHKTKEQRYKDYVRERFLQKKLITVIRFTGSEVFVDAEKCAKECLEIIDNFASEIDRREVHSFYVGKECAKKRSITQRRR